MGFKGKFLKRFKRRSNISSDASIDNTTIATKEVIPTTHTGKNYDSTVEPSPIRLPVLGLDPEGKTADEADIPSTPKVSILNDATYDSPAHTSSTKSSSVKSEIETSAEGQNIPSLTDNGEQETNILSDITGVAFGLVTKNSDVSESSKKVAVNGVPDNGYGKETLDAPPKVAIAPKLSSAEVEIQRASSALEYTSAPVDLDAEISSSNVGSMHASDVEMDEKVRSSDSKVSQFGRVFSRGVGSTVVECEVKADLDESKDMNKNDKVEKDRYASDDATQEDHQIKTSTSWVKDIEKHMVPKTSSDEASKKSRQVSFDDESHHIEDDHYMAYEPYSDEEESSFDSSEDFDDDSEYYDEHYDYNDDIDEASYMSGNSGGLTENDGIWGWLCGYNNLNLSPGSIEDQQNEDKSVGTCTVASTDDQGSVHSNDSVDVNTGAPVEEGEEMMYKQEEIKSNRTLPSAKMGRKLRVASPAPKLLPSLLKKKEPKQNHLTEEQLLAENERTTQDQQVVENSQEKEVTEQKQPQDQPRDDQGFPVEAITKKESPSKSQMLKQSASPKQNFKKQQDAPADVTQISVSKHPVEANTMKEKPSKSPVPFKPMLKHTVSAAQSSKRQQDAPADVTQTTSVSKHKQHESTKESRQLEIYCKSHGGAENLVLRKYPSIPSPAGKHHVMVKVEASTVSSRDCLLRLQGDPTKQPSPSVPGFQIVGTIHALGDGLKADGDLQVGDRIAALTQGGGNARFISIPASSAILLPPTATHENTVCLVSNYMTAYQALKLAKMKKGGAPLTNTNVLITGGSGPIGQALIDLASREGANVHTTAHQMHQEHLTKNLKADWHPVNPNKWLPELEGQMDVVVDSLCVDGYESSYKALASDGVLVCTGNISAALDKDQTDSFFESKKLALWWSDVKAKHVWRNCFFYNIYESYANDPKLFQQELLYLYLQMENGGIKPKVAGRVSLNQVPKAQRLIEKGLPNGTVILNPWKKLDPKQNVPIEKCK